MEEKFGWCFIGCGNIAHSVCKAILNGNHRIVSVFSRNREKGEAFTAEFGGTWYPTLAEALSAPGVEGVYIATTNESHYSYMEACLEAGMPVLCEKPLCLNANETCGALAAYTSRGLYLAEGMWTWHNEVSLRVRELVKSGAIGAVTHFRCVYADDKLDRIPLDDRRLAADKGGGSLLDIGIYAVRYVYEILGRPSGIEVKNARMFNGVDVDENMIFTYGDLKAEIVSSFDSPEGEYCEIRGTRGEIKIPNFHKATELTGKICGAEFTYAPYESSREAFLAEFDHVAADIRNGETESAYVPHRATLVTAELMDEILKQVKSE